MRAHYVLSPELGALYPCSLKTLTMALQGGYYYTHLPHEKRRERGESSGECQNFTPHPPAVGPYWAYSHSVCLSSPPLPPPYTVTSRKPAACPETASYLDHVLKCAGEREVEPGLRPYKADHRDTGQGKARPLAKGRLCYSLVPWVGSGSEGQS